VTAGVWIGPPQVRFTSDALETLWQVEATMVGLGLALIIFALQSGASSAGFRRDLALSLSFPAAVNLGLLLTVLTGLAVFDASGAFGRWLALVVAVVALAWALALFAAVRDAINVADPVERIRARRKRLLRATQELLRRELLRNVATSILEADVRAAGGTYSPFSFPSRAPGVSVLRAAQDGQVVDINRRRLLDGVRRAAGRGLAVNIWLRLWEQVGRDTIIGEVAQEALVPVAGRVRRALWVQPPRAVGDLGSAIESLHVEARLSLGPDTTALDAVLETYDAVLQAYALGWRRFVPALTDEHVSLFLEGSGVPVDAIQRAVYDLTEAALQTEALEAVRTLLFYPSHVVGNAVTWRAPAYLRLASLPQHFYVAIATSSCSDTFRRRVLELPWLYLVETLTYSLALRGHPYVANPNQEALSAARWAVRRGLVGVLRQTIHQGDLANFREGLRRWRIAERDNGDREETDPFMVPVAVRCPIPLAWEVVRRQSAGALANAGDWLRLAIGDVTLEELVAAVDGQLDGDERLANLGDWVSFDLPSHEAHYIDDQSDLLRALIVGACLRGESERPVPPIRIGGGLYSVREGFERVLKAIQADAPLLEDAFGIDDLAARAAEFADAYRRALAEYERAERDRIRAAAVDPGRVSAFAAAFRKAVTETELRSLVSREGRSESAAVAPPPRAWLRARRLVDKTFFVASRDAVGAESIGEMYGKSLGRAEQSRLVHALAVGRVRAFGKRTVTERLLAAASELGGTGHQNVVFLVPDSWEFTSALEREGPFVRAVSRHSGPLGELAGCPVYGLGDRELHWAAAMLSGSTLTFRQFVSSAREPLVAEVQEIDDALAATLMGSGTTVDGDPGESMAERLKLRVLLVTEEAIEFQVDPPEIRRVAIPVYARPHGATKGS
jgi:hypothetical protein